MTPIKSETLSSNTAENIAETLARELKTPYEIAGVDNIRRVALPPGWKMDQFDDSILLPHPLKKTASATLNDAVSFIAYLKRHADPLTTTVWCLANYTQCEVKFTAIIDDHGGAGDLPRWKKHSATYAPAFSSEWREWAVNNKKPMSQADFAQFIENNLRDITGTSGGATGAQMLEMALSFEAKQDSRFKSAIRLQSGGIRLSFVDDQDAATVAAMDIFDRFAIGVPVFWNSQAYQIDARLRYRVREGKLTFWYELIRADKTLEDATTMLIDLIKTQTELPFFFGAA